MTTDTSHDPEHCREMFARMSEYIDREVSPETRLAMERHLRRCPHCRICAATLRRTIALYSCLQDQPVPEKFASRLRRILAHGDHAF